MDDPEGIAAADLVQRRVEPELASDLSTVDCRHKARREDERSKADPPITVTAYIVMAYKAMVCIDMACKVWLHSYGLYSHGIQSYGLHRCGL